MQLFQNTENVLNPILIGVAELLTRDSDKVSLSTHLPELNK